jgi:hypothetical protein
MRIVIIKNNTDTTKQWIKEFAALEEWTVPDGSDLLLKKYGMYDPFLIAVANGEASIGNGAEFFTSIAQQLNWLNGNPAADANGIPSVVLNSPAAFDAKPIVQASPRPIGTYTYLSAQSDNPNDPSETSGGVKLKYSHAIGQNNANQNIYFDINSICNETHLNGAYLQWVDANLDEVEVEIVCKASDAAFVAGTNTNYKIVSGILITTAGNGDVSIPDWDLILPVQMVPNEHGVRPSGYWDCDYNTTTHKFENYVFNSRGTGEFNIFSEEIEFNCFIPSFPMLKCGQQSIESKDVTRLGHNMRIKALIKTEQTVDDHAWKFCAVVYLYRKHT